MLVDRQPVNALLGEFKSSEENGVYDARATHGNAKTCLHVRWQNLDRSEKGKSLPRYMRAWKKWILGLSAFSRPPTRQFRWYMLFAVSIGKIYRTR